MLLKSFELTNALSSPQFDKSSQHVFNMPGAYQFLVLGYKNNIASNDNLCIECTSMPVHPWSSYSNFLTPYAACTPVNVVIQCGQQKNLFFFFLNHLVRLTLAVVWFACPATRTTLVGHNFNHILIPYRSGNQ